MGSQSWWEGQQQPHPCAQGPESRRHPQPLSFSCCRHQLRRPQGQAAVPPRASQGRWTPNYKHGVRKRKPSDRSSENGVSRDESFTIRILFYGLNLLPNLKVSVRDAGKGRGGGGGRRAGGARQTRAPRMRRRWTRVRWQRRPAGGAGGKAEKGPWAPVGRSRPRLLQGQALTHPASFLHHSWNQVSGPCTPASNGIPDPRANICSSAISLSICDAD